MGRDRVAEAHPEEDPDEGRGQESLHETGLDDPLDTVLDRRAGRHRYVHDHRRGLVELLIGAVDQRQQGDHDDRATDPEEASEGAADESDERGQYDEVQVHVTRVYPLA